MSMGANYIFVVGRISFEFTVIDMLKPRVMHIGIIKMALKGK